MRAFLLLAAVLAMGVSGCISNNPTTATTTATTTMTTTATVPTMGNESSCPITSSPSGEGGPVEVQVANTMEKATCVRVLFDGTLVASGQLEGETPGLHNNPRELARFAWETRDVVVRVEDATTGSTHEETLRLVEGESNYVVAWVDEAGITIRLYTSEPRWA